LATVHIPALLRPLIGGVSEMDAAGSTLRELVAEIVRQQPALSDRIADAAGILPEIMVAIGDTEAKDLDAPVPEGAEVWILPSIAGGSGDFRFAPAASCSGA
jgi:molybdopterin converting factor small subunit